MTVADWVNLLIAVVALAVALWSSVRSYRREQRFDQEVRISTAGRAATPYLRKPTLLIIENFSDSVVEQIAVLVGDIPVDQSTSARDSTLLPRGRHIYDLPEAVGSTDEVVLTYHVEGCVWERRGTGPPQELLGTT